MPRKNHYQYTEENQGKDDTRRPSRSQRKRDSSALQDLGKELSALPLRELAKLGLAPDLLEAFRALGKMSSHEARRRQMQYIGRLMREEEDVERLRLAVEYFKDGRLPSEVAGREANS